jgi:RNA polymerase sigma factor (sigma-70 family)
MAADPDDPTLDAPRTAFDAASFRDYDKQLYRYLVRRMPRPQDAEDLVQEVYLRLLRVDSSKRVHKPLAYIYGIASHVVADYRSDARQEHAVLCEHEEEEYEGGPELHMDDLIDRLNLQQQLERALSQLPRTQALVLLAHKHHGLSYEEVAAELGLSIHTVEKYVTQAKARIRTMTWER